jgi:prepilin-type N-terminal cleavage/methylation domain-containing protein
MVVKLKQSGFTLVELLIVIVVIAILAAITVVAYNGVQQRARDSRRKSDVGAIAKALILYQVDNGPMGAGSGCGSGGNGSGYFNYSYASPSADMNECLKLGKYLSTDIKDPNNTGTCNLGDINCRKYLKYTCSQSGTINTYVYANLETAGHTASDTDGTCGSTLDTDYGMNHYLKISG